MLVATDRTNTTYRRITLMADKSRLLRRAIDSGLAAQVASRRNPGPASTDPASRVDCAVSGNVTLRERRGPAARRRGRRAPSDKGQRHWRTTSAYDDTGRFTSRYGDESVFGPTLGQSPFKG